MNDKAFPTPVALRLDGKIRKVSTAFEALECLLGPWPATACREYRSALRACRDCLDGLRSPVAAFRAFKAACRVVEALPKELMRELSEHSGVRWEISRSVPESRARQFAAALDFTSHGVGGQPATGTGFTRSA